MNSLKIQSSKKYIKPWKGFISVEDTQLYLQDSGGLGPVIIYLNGSYANLKHWDRVIQELGTDYRHILYDERARGKSKKSKDYSFDACLRDLTAIIKARQIKNPILVGWSYGAILATHWVNKNPGVARGIIAIDSAVPYGLTGEESQKRIYKLFNRLKWILPVIAPLGLAAKMSAKQHAEINIEINEISAKLEQTLLDINIPVWYVFASGESRGGEAHEFKAMRDSLNPLLKKNENLKVFKQVESNHEKILSKDYKTIGNAIQTLNKNIK